MPEGIVKANGIDIWHETFGNPSHQTVLLIGGAFSQALLWVPEFCQGIVDGGRHVVWYDNRDIGLSEWPDEPYTLWDMADDAIGLLDALGIEAAHLVGASMGGMIAQLVALRYPERTLSLTSIMSTPGWIDPSLDPIDEMPPTIAERVGTELGQALARKMHFMSLANPGVAYNLDHIAAIEWDIKDAPEGGAVMEKQVQKAAIGFQTP